VVKDLTAFRLGIATILTKTRYVCFFYFGPMLIPSAEIQRKIAVDDIDPDFIEYIKPKPKTKVGVLSSVYIYKGADA
jgi:hypothetical protein